MRPFRLASLLLPLLALGLSGGTRAAEAPLTLDVYNPGSGSVFAVSSVLVEGQRDAVLVDAQFERKDAEVLVQRIRASGKRLTAIYVSHGDPDYYFGLDVLHRAFPAAAIVATAPTVAHIEESRRAKLAYWGPILKDNAPARTLVPAALAGDSLDLEGHRLEIVGLDGPTPDRSFVWIPSIRAVVGGIPVVGGEHVWMADTQTPQSHAHWLATLDRIERLHPRTVVPGHYAPGAPMTLAAVRFTRDYIRAYDAEAARAGDAAALVAAMKRRYPQAAGVSALELSAKVSKGEMKWP
ncbi:MBL fold metallo-hydrolase [Frateuria sp. Soil773]|uniref:MBL fold metallo-hydrolase n=1 Tax=Frateuria sp. Soil773 TaxID=1736407 RepID=UPI0006FEFE1C|nr:MBL fold metallo-hydrolase [Frateuria sp. Soil773]KRE89364.1 MBL fold metallo-hydrolase [Frateuria sp. Soil773]